MEKLSSSTLFLSSLAAALFLFSVSHAATPPSPPPSFVDKTCHLVGGQYITHDECMQILSADPNSGTAANSKTLAIIALNITIANGTATEAKFDALLKAPASSDPFYKKALEGCKGLYSASMWDLRWVADAVAADKYRSANEMIFTARINGHCGGLFEKDQPLLAEETAFMKCVLLSTSLVELLQ